MFKTRAKAKGDEPEKRGKEESHAKSDKKDNEAPHHQIAGKSQSGQTQTEDTEQLKEQTADKNAEQLKETNGKEGTIE